MPTPYEAKRISGTDLGKTITGTNRENEPASGSLTKIEHMPTWTILVLNGHGHWFHPNTLLTITGQPSPPNTTPTSVLCGHNGGQGIGAGHTCQCVRAAGHPMDSDRPHGCSCFALWGN